MQANKEDGGACPPKPDNDESWAGMQDEKICRVKEARSRPGMTIRQLPREPKLRAIVAPCVPCGTETKVGAGGNGGICSSTCLLQRGNVDP